MSAELLSHINTWSKEAKCRDKIDDDTFFGPTRSHNINGKKFCTGLLDDKPCPVINQCRTYALVHNLEGIWGGTSYQDRINLGPVIRDFLIYVYQHFGLYDHFLLLVATSLGEVLQQEQQSEQFYPIAVPDLASDSILGLSA